MQKLLLVTLLISSCALSSNSDIEIWLARNVNYFEVENEVKLLSFPWHTKAQGDGEIVVTNSCGLFRLRFDQMERINEVGKVIDQCSGNCEVLTSFLSEFCTVDFSISDQYVAVEIKKFENKYYLLESFYVSSTNNGKVYIASRELSDKMFDKNNIRKIFPDSRDCIPLEYLSKNQEKNYLEFYFANVYGSELCFDTGVHISRPN